MTAGEAPCGLASRSGPSTRQFWWLDYPPPTLYPQRMQNFVHFLIPAFAVATFLVLCVGLFALFRGGQFNRSYSNKLMRWRILLQFIAIILIGVASFAFRN